MIGRMLGSYHVLAELGRGGMGVVYLALDTRLQRQVAIKMLPLELAREPERIARLEREARLLASLDHPNIATIHALGDLEDGSRYVVLKYIEGEALDRRLRRGRPPLDEALRIVEQLASGVEAAHQRGVIHRDLKPSNVMLSPEGTVKVLDFGLGKALPSGEGSDLTTSSGSLLGHMAGTPGYMSPEQIAGRATDRLTDVFAFGSVAFECLAGCRAFPGRTSQEAIAATLSQEPEWSALPRDLPDSVQSALRRCLAKDPYDRSHDLREVRLEIEAVRERETSVRPPIRRAELPVPVTSFVGRVRELDDLEELIGHSRLLTLTGMGGCGKTRLALRFVGSMTKREVLFVDLGLVTEARRTPRAVAAALGLHEQPDRDTTDLLVEWLRPRSALLLLDNCEHLLPDSSALTQVLLERCPHVVVLATSREPLGVPGEQSYGVPPLEVPEAQASEDAILSSESGRLFLERARLSDPGFHVDAEGAHILARLCRRLEGIPLAIELAAARVRALSLQEIDRRLDDRFRLLIGGCGDARHQTLRAALEWSHDQLKRREQRLFRSLAVFSGGWTLEAAASICGNGDELEMLDLLSRVVDKSLVLARTSGREPARFRFLETIREYALEKSDSGELRALRARHLTFFAELVARGQQGILGPEQADWYATLDREHENLLAALLTCDRQNQSETALRMLGVLWRFWHARGLLQTGREEIARALNRRSVSKDERLRLEPLLGAGLLALEAIDLESSRCAYEEVLATARRLEDQVYVARALNGLGAVAAAKGDSSEGRRLFEESLEVARRARHDRATAVAMLNLAEVATEVGDWQRGHDLAAESLTVRRRFQESQGIALALAVLAQARIRLGRTLEAAESLRECLERVRELGQRSLASRALDLCAELGTRLEDPAFAARLDGAAEAMRERTSLRLAKSEETQRATVVRSLLLALGPSKLETLQQEGRTLGFETALSTALDWLGAVQS